jgi:plasmid replication initiation protein
MEIITPSWQKQPDPRSMVWQHNRLAEARYELTAREQKLLLYVIAMIEPEDDEFKRYVINVAEFAELAGLDKDHLYTELRALAKNLASKPLVIPDHYDPVTGRRIELITHWFESAMIAKNGCGYFAVRISLDLKPYLLQVKKEFFRFRLHQVMQLRSTYAIRLYQWLKRWEFRRTVEVPVVDLRLQIGAASLNQDGKPTDVSLSLYPDFKRRAVQPAVEEINLRTDLRVSFSEIKAHGSKAVERLLFKIGRKRNQVDSDALPLGPVPQLELSLGRGAVEAAGPLAGLPERFGLNEKQWAKVLSYVREKGEAYVVEKIDVVTQSARKNAAQALLAALRDDWKPAVRISKPAAPSRKAPPKCLSPEPQPEPDPIDQEVALKQLRLLRETLRGSTG